MIRSLDILKPGGTPVPWLGEVAALKKPRKFELAPGLNIFWGQNGSGKTTVLKLLARLFHCELGGFTAVTQGSIQAIFGMKHEDPRASLRGVEVDHDGQGVFSFDPSHEVGITAGGAGMDWDFAREGIANRMFRGSAGETTMSRFDRILGPFFESRKAPTIEYRMDRDRLNPIWSERVDVVERFLKGNGVLGPPTILMDEPEKSLDLPSQANFWRLVRALAREAQVIVASHSIFALNIPEAAYFEMGPGYLDASKDAVALLHGWPTEQPSLNRPDRRAATAPPGRRRRPTKKEAAKGKPADRKGKA